MSLRERLASAFVEPAPAPALDAAPRWEPPTAPVPAAARSPSALSTVALVCAPRDARLAGGAAGLALLRAAPVPAAIVMAWGAGLGGRAPRCSATPAARRLVSALGTRGLEARATGRLAHIALPAEPAEASRAARMVLGWTLAPSVLVLAGARETPLEEVLARHPMALFASRTGAGAELSPFVLADLEALGVSAGALALDAPPVVAALARVGVALLSPLRERLAAAPGGRAPC